MTEMEVAELIISIISVVVDTCAQFEADNKDCSQLLGRCRKLRPTLQQLMENPSTIKSKEHSLRGVHTVMVEIKQYCVKYADKGVMGRSWVALRNKSRFAELNSLLSENISDLQLELGAGQGAGLEELKSLIRQLIVVHGLETASVSELKLRVGPLVRDSQHLSACVRAGQKEEEEEEGAETKAESMVGVVDSRWVELDVAQLQWEASVETLLGRGGFGVVYRGKYAGVPRAVKQLQLVGTPTAKELTKFRKEAGIAKLARHENVIWFVGAIVSQAVMVLELAICSLSDVLHKGNVLPGGSTLRTVAEGRAVIEDVCRGLAYLHMHRIVHRDIKSGNILLVARPGTSGGVIGKISDFGLATASTFTATASISKSERAVGSDPYMAPELLDFDGQPPYSSASDMYALGVTAGEMFVRTVPWAGLKNLQIGMKVAMKEQRPFPFPVIANCSDADRRLCEFIGRSDCGCLHQSPDERPGAIDMATATVSSATQVTTQSIADDATCMAELLDTLSGPGATGCDKSNGESGAAAGVAVNAKDVFTFAPKAPAKPSGMQGNVASVAKDDNRIDAKLVRSDKDMAAAVKCWLSDESEGVRKYGHISDWNVSAVTNMKKMFYEAKTFNQDLSRWDVSAVTNMEGMFAHASSFNQDLSRWDVSAVTNMELMFAYASSFNQDLSRWDVSAVTNMERMFYEAKTFNQDLSRWDVSAVTNMKFMFAYASSFNHDLSRWDVSAVTNMEYMFSHASSFNQDLSRWDVSAVTNMEKMFLYASSFNLARKPPFLEN